MKLVTLTYNNEPLQSIECHSEDHLKEVLSDYITMIIDDYNNSSHLQIEIEDLQ